MKGQLHTYKMTVLEGHLDSFGHMNNATYLQILEEARWDMITERGYGYKEIQERKIGPTILEIHLNFRRELKLREQITIESQIVEYKSRVGVIHQEIKGPEGDLRCRAKLKLALLDMSARKLIQPTPEWLHAIGCDPSSIEDR